MARGATAAWAGLVPLVLSCSRTALEDSASLEAPPLRYLARDLDGECQYGVQKTFLRRDGSPRALTYESVDPCPPGNAEHRWVLTTARYVLTFPYWGWGDEGEQMLVLDAETLEELRRGGPFESDEYDMFACTVGDSELWVMPEGLTVWVVDLETLDVTGSFELPGSSELPEPTPPYFLFAGCASDGDRAFVCVDLGETQDVFEVRLADHSLVDQDLFTSGVQGFPLPSSFGCHLVMDAARSRLFVGLNVRYRYQNTWQLLSIDLSPSGAAEPRPLLPGDRFPLVTDLHPVVLPGGEVFALLESAEWGWEAREEWIRIDPESGDIVSLREADYHDEVGLPPRGARALPAVGDWIVTLVPPRANSDTFGFEYFNAMTGETGPSLVVDDERPQELFPLPPSD